MKSSASPSSRWRLAVLTVAAALTLSANHAQAQAIVTSGNVSYGTFNWTLNGNTTSNTPVVYDQVNARNAGSTLTVAAGSTFNVIFGTGVDLSNTFWNSNQSWVVFSGFKSPGSSGSFTTLTVPSTLNTFRPGATFTVGAATTGSVTLSYTGAAYVPEPTSALAGFLCLAGLLRRRRPQA